jgi:hypothetical protein
MHIYVRRLEASALISLKLNVSHPKRPLNFEVGPVSKLYVYIHTRIEGNFECLEGHLGSSTEYRVKTRIGNKQNLEEQTTTAYLRLGRRQ